MIKIAFIFAAGMGKRLAEIANGLPKPLVKFKGKRLIDYAINNFLNHGEIKILVNICHEAALIRGHLSQYDDNRLKIVQESQLLETGGAIVNAFSLIDSYRQLLYSEAYFGFSKYIFTANADLIWDGEKILSTMENLFLMLHSLGKNIDIIMLFRKQSKGNAIRFDVLDNNEVIMGEGLPYVFCGLQIINVELIMEYSVMHLNKKIFSLSEIYLASRAQNGKLNNVYGAVCDDVYHVGTKEEFLLYEDMLR